MRIPVPAQPSVRVAPYRGAPRHRRNPVSALTAAPPAATLAIPPDTARLGGLGAATPSRDEIVGRHWNQVYRLSWRLTGNRQDAEDLTQETFVRVFRSLDSYRPTGRFEGWLHRITTNLFLDGARRRQRIRMEVLAEDSEIADTSLAPEHRFASESLDTDIQAALAALSPKLRAAVVLCDIEGLPYEEIAKTLGVKLGTVQSRIHRGRSELRTALAHRRGEIVRDNG
nr:RNA polymerase sigma factor SigE [Actinomycetales bacterium]